MEPIPMNTLEDNEVSTLTSVRVLRQTLEQASAISNLTFRCSIFLKPKTLEYKERINALRNIANPFSFEVIEYMSRPEVSRPDYGLDYTVIMYGEHTYFDTLAVNMIEVMTRLKSQGHEIISYRFDNALFDSKDGDIFNILDTLSMNTED